MTARLVGWVSVGWQRIPVLLGSLVLASAALAAGAGRPGRRGAPRSPQESRRRHRPGGRGTRRGRGRPAIRRTTDRAPARRLDRDRGRAASPRSGRRARAAEWRVVRRRLARLGDLVCGHGPHAAARFHRLEGPAAVADRSPLRALLAAGLPATIRVEEIVWGGVGLRGHPGARFAPDDSGGFGLLPASRRAGLRDRDRRRRARLSTADPRLARDGQRHGRRSPDRARVLHALRLRDRVRTTGRERASLRLRIFRPADAKQQADGGPTDPYAVGPAQRAAGPRTARRWTEAASARPSQRRHDLARLAPASSRHGRAVARYGTPSPLRARCRLRGLLRVDRHDVPGSGHTATGPEGPRVRPRDRRGGPRLFDSGPHPGQRRQRPRCRPERRPRGTPRSDPGRRAQPAQRPEEALRGRRARSAPMRLETYASSGSHGRRTRTS